MSAVTPDPIDVVFGNLDQWRHLPSYQLERRADIFFSVYLKDVIQKFTGVALKDEILPELPIRRSLIEPGVTDFTSVKVDYALFAQDQSRVILVELKTDRASRRTKQDRYLENAKALGFLPIAEGIRAIMLESQQRRKYLHLAAALERLGYFTLPPELLDGRTISARKLGELFAKITVVPTASEVHVVYVQPKAGADDASCIDFVSFSAHVAQFSDPVSTAFSRHLLEWTHSAGARPPKAR